MQDTCKQEIDIEKWKWISEEVYQAHLRLHTCDLTYSLAQRPTRQFNMYDCGPFICADIVSLVETGKPSSLAQKDMVLRRTAQASKASAARGQRQEIDHYVRQQYQGHRNRLIARYTILYFVSLPDLL
ncbi:hypothetical protein BOTBODRAFT_558775 [Botryobasidium botryosum FD-172 SS1]|uniref:Ubiquitin-like protease family profile domain-containing protein n=1 Tax=Botryobasidium botryosum (strain FD-172 SS1) TaxID=930990 RepID=A0A067MB23_BOTB1|nr:hypothetical protein BOTBODRAFT_558775 [Botryobasidium botryosum FD-172 SS1]